MVECTNPQLIEVPIGEITLIATAVNEGVVRILDRNDVAYSHTHRCTGAAAPTNEFEFHRIREGEEMIESWFDIDVYILIQSETRSGNITIRLDL